MTSRPCQICKAPVDRDGTTSYFPFCSQRCRTIDLGQWLDGRYAVPGEPAPDVESQDQEPQTKPPDA